MKLRTLRSTVAAAVALGCALALSGPARAAILRVPGDYARINLALAAAASGDTIQVVGNGGATYVDRLVISRDVTIEGGWRADFQTRDPSIYVSVVRDVTQQYTRSAIRIDGAPRVVLDGLTVIGGRLGIEAAGGPDLVLRDCNFRDQSNLKGGFGDQPGAAIYQQGGTLLAEGVTTQNGLSAYSGPGMALVDVPQVILRDCVLRRGTTRSYNGIDDFEPAHGGGLLLRNCGALMERVEVSQCVSQLDGAGGLYAIGSMVDMRDCTFSQCISPREEGGGLFLVDCPSVAMTGCTFEACTAARGGGFNAQRVASLTVTDTRFAGNNAAIEGGAVWIDASTIAFDRDTLDANNPGNLAFTQRGGGAWLQNTSGLVGNTIIQGEGAIGAGGGWYQIGGDVVFRGCQLRNNTSGFYGGATHIEVGGSIRLERCLIEGNFAKLGGGCSASFTAQLEADHCTFTGNSVVNAGASLYLDTAARATVSNTIACCSPRGAQIECNAATATVTYSDFWNDDTVNTRTEFVGCTNAAGSRNILLDPGFCTGDPTFLLSSSSPCLGAASDGGDIGWAGNGCARPLRLTTESWGRIKARYGSPD